MRFSTIVSAALAATPIAVSAAQASLGFALGVKNPDGKCKGQSDFEKDFDVLKAHSNVVRTYAASDCDNAKPLVQAAKKKDFKIVFGVWPDVPESFNADKKALENVVPGNENVIAAITVGSEALYRKDMKPQELLSKIKTIKKLFPEVPVGTAESWNKYADGTADPIILGGVDYFLVNAFAFWQGQHISNATATLFDDMVQAIDHIRNIAGDRADDIYIAVGETGWPTKGGTDYDAAKAGDDNAKTFHDEGICAMLDWGVDTFYFEAFDEPWKPDTTGDNGEPVDETHWGMYTADRQPKFEVSCKNKG